ncbi:MAG: hypothetical protein HYY31_06820 [Chloroflexi bacterium]|nr:hypothetical protein [Chloroflexota bacterium]
MAIVRTVLGDIPPQQLGITYVHEHIVLGYNNAREDMGHRFNREAVLRESIDDLGRAVRSHGVKTIVDVTPPEVGRDVDLMQEVARRLNINIICATGHYHKMSGGVPFYWNLSDIEVFEEWMTREITQGVGPNNVKCGVIKVAMGTWKGGAELHPGEEKAFRAAGRVSKKLGVSICIHAGGWHTPAEKVGPLQAVDILLSEGADPSRIQLGHLDGARGKLSIFLEAAKRGVYMAFDVIGRNKEEGDPIRVAAVSGLVGLGYLNRILLSMDHQGAWVPERPPRYVGLKTRFTDLYDFLPKLMGDGGLTDKEIERILVDNPRELLAF